MLNVYDDCHNINDNNNGEGDYDNK